MKISYNWLKQHIDIDLSAEKLSELLTDCGLEVESLDEVCAVKGGLKGVVVGEVIQKEKHPDADRLSLTKVDIGNNIILDIVCGAPNVAKGQKVLVATLGTIIHLKDNSFEIKKSKIRGFISEGMICAEDELSLGDSHDGILVLPSDAVIGTTASEYLNIETDWIFEIGLTPNRADAASHLGVARDIQALLRCRNLLPVKEKEDIKLKYEDTLKIECIEKGLKIDISIEDPDACPRYTGITISNITVKESPNWLKNKLNAIGLKPINNIVDISNYILFDIGQPLHIFDADKIKGNKVIIKKYNKDYDFISLDGMTRKMGIDDLMICNTEEPMCIAGIYGGLNSGVTSETRNIFIESAYFNPQTIRRTSKRLGIKTDASFRFERGTDPNMTLRALKDAVKLILELAGGIISSEVNDVYPQPFSNQKVTFNYAKFNSISGKIIEKEVIKNIINALEITIIKENSEQLYLSVPTYRVDVTREIDVIEDVLRIYGFNNIELPDTIKVSLSHSSKPDKEKIIDCISDFLSSKGYNEMMNNSLSKSDYYEKINFYDSSKTIKLLNPLSKDLESLRQTLIYSGLETIVYNHNRKSLNLKLFEYGKVYTFNGNKKDLLKYDESYKLAIFQTGYSNLESWNKPQEKFNFYTLKADVIDIIKRLGISTDILKITKETNILFDEGLCFEYKKQTLVSFGSLHSDILKFFNIKQNVLYAEINVDLLMHILANIRFAYKEIPKFPKMRRDLALLINENIEFSEIERIAKSINNAFLTEISLFDIYKGDKIDAEKKSYAVSFIFQNPQRTLTDEEVDKIMAQLINQFIKKLDAVIR